MREVGTGGRMKATKTCSHQVHCSPNLCDRRSGHLQGLQAHLSTPLFTDLVLLLPKINYFLCLLPAFFLLCHLPKGGKHIHTLI